MTFDRAQSIPITQAGQLIPEAGMLVLGYMLYPNCERSAHQFTRVVAEETIAKARDTHCNVSQVFAAQIDLKLTQRLLLAGQVALRVCSNYVRYGNADFRKAAHVISELNSTVKTLEGKPVPTAEGRLRKTFLEYQATMHFWAAASVGYKGADGNIFTGIDAIAQMLVGYEFLGQFLNAARQFEEILAKAKPCDHSWSATEHASDIWNFNDFPRVSLAEQPETVTHALSSYQSPGKF